MKIVYLIGNGFDLNLGLKTKFRHFYDYYIKQESPITVVNIFKKDLDAHKNIEQWADLELVLGDYAKYFYDNTVLNFRKLLIDIQDKLAEYINLQTTNFALTETDEKKINEDLFFPNKYLTPREKSAFLSYKNNFDLHEYIADVITFNYTDTFEKFYSFNGKSKKLGTHLNGYNDYPNTLNSVEHIHGTTKSNMILGINDVSQLNNEELRKNLKAIRSIVKPEMNKNAGTLRDERSLKLIREADLLCVYGMSLGATDKIWWKAICDRLINSNSVIIIFTVNDGTPEIRGFLSEDDKDEIKEKLTSYGIFSDSQLKDVLDRIFVCINSKMFTISSLSHKKSAA